MWENFYQPPITINEEAYIEHYNKCITAVFNRILANIAASGLAPEDFLIINRKAIIDEIQAVKATFMTMLSFPDESYTDEFGVKLSRILLNKLHTFTHQSVKKGMLPGYN